MARYKLDSNNIDADKLFEGSDRNKRRPRNPKSGAVKNSKDVSSGNMDGITQRDRYTVMPLILGSEGSEESARNGMRLPKASEFENSGRQRRANRLNKRNGDVVGIKHGTEDIDIDTTPVGELFPGQQVGAAAVKERSARQLDESIRKSIDDYKLYDDRYNSVIGDLESAGKLGKYDAVQAKKGELPYQTWERATGLKWSEAKKRGYTTGRDQENLQLQRDLLAGNVSKQGGYSDERPEGYKNSKLGQGSYYLAKPKQTSATQSKASTASASKPAASTSKATANTSVGKQVESNNTKIYSNVNTETNKNDDIVNDVDNNSVLTYNNDIGNIGASLVSPRTPRTYNPRDYTTWGLKPRILKTKEEKEIEDQIKRNFKAHYLYGIPVPDPEYAKYYPPKYNYPPKK